jgi:hypothetical protein
LCIALTAFTRICYCDVSTLRSGGYNEAACGAMTTSLIQAN